MSFPCNETIAYQNTVLCLFGAHRYQSCYARSMCAYTIAYTYLYGCSQATEGSPWHTTEKAQRILDTSGG